MKARLYNLRMSHPARTARLMLDHKGIEYDLVECLPGLHPQQLRLAGFRGPTVPALKLNGERVQGTRAISRALEEAKPEPRLFPADPDLRVKVEEAERWGDEEFQDFPRQYFRWALVNNEELARWFVKASPGPPIPAGLGVRLGRPMAKRFANRSGGTDEGVRAGIVTLPGRFDQVDRLLAEGVIGGQEPNAADFQIAPTVRALMGFEDFQAFVESRPCSEWAAGLVDAFPGRVPASVPAEWLEPLRASQPA